MITARRLCGICCSLPWRRPEAGPCACGGRHAVELLPMALRYVDAQACARLWAVTFERERRDPQA